MRYLFLWAIGLIMLWKSFPSFFENPHNSRNRLFSFSKWLGYVQNPYQCDETRKLIPKSTRKSILILRTNWIGSRDLPIVSDHAKANKADSSVKVEGGLPFLNLTMKKISFMLVFMTQFDYQITVKDINSGTVYSERFLRWKLVNSHLQHKNKAKEGECEFETEYEWNSRRNCWIWDGN